MAIKITVEVIDDANPNTPPIKIDVIEEGYGVALSLKNANGFELGRVALDYHDNELKGLVYEQGKDEPKVVCLTFDVAEDLKCQKTESSQPVETATEPAAPKMLLWGRTRVGKVWHFFPEQPTRVYPESSDKTKKHMYHGTTACGLKDAIISPDVTPMACGTTPEVTPGTSSMCLGCNDRMTFLERENQ